MKKLIYKTISILKSIPYWFKSIKRCSLPKNATEIIDSIRPYKEFDYSFDYCEGESDVVLSIGITTFNCSKWIENTIQTIKSQPFREGVEIVFVDNASTDDTVELIKKGTENLLFPFRIIINNKNGMAGYSRTRVIENSKGRFVLFVDGDDGLLNGAIDKALNIIRKEPEVDLIQLGPIEYSEKEKIITDNKSLFSIGGMPGGKIINRKTWGELSFPINCNFEDTVFALNYYFRVKKAYVSSTDDYWIRPVNPESLSRKKTPSFLDHIRVVPFLYDKINLKNDFTYQLLLRHFGLIAFERIKNFDLLVQLAAFSLMRDYVLSNRIDHAEIPRKYRQIEKSFLKGNYYRWVATSYMYY